MKQYIIIFCVLFMTSQAYAADIDPTKIPKDFHSLPSDIKNIIITHLINEGSFEEKINSLRKLFIGNPALGQVSELLDILTKQLKVPKSALAFALNMPATQAWLQKMYPSNTFYIIFNEASDNVTLNIDFINSDFFIKLVELVGKVEFLSKLTNLLKQYQSMKKSPIAAEILNKIAILFIAGSDFLENTKIMEILHSNEFLRTSIQRMNFTPSSALHNARLHLLMRIKKIENGDESDKTASGTDYDTDHHASYDSYDSGDDFTPGNGGSSPATPRNR